MKPEQQQRYARHLSLEGFGRVAQEKLLASTVLMVGAGGLGCPAAQYLAAAGVGRLIIMDDDQVELSNLQRQILHGHSHVGMNKALSAQKRILEINPDTEVMAIQERCTEANVRNWVSQADVILDGADNFPTRYLLNDAAYLEQKPLVHGSIFHHEGQLSVFHRNHGPCYRCLYPNPPRPGTVPSCAEAGVLGVLPGVVGSMMATEAIKLIAGIGEPLVGTLLSYDALYMETSRFGIKRKQNCPLCGDSPSLHDAKAIAWACEVQSPELESCGFDDLEAMGQVGRDYLLLDVRNVSEVEAGSIPGHLNIPLGELGERRHELKSWENRPVVCQCQSGVRSLKAASVLLEHGFSQVSNLKGGYMGWLASQ